MAEKKQYKEDNLTKLKYDGHIWEVGHFGENNNGFSTYGFRRDGIKVRVTSRYEAELIANLLSKALELEAEVIRLREQNNKYLYLINDWQLEITRLKISNGKLLEALKAIVSQTNSYFDDHPFDETMSFIRTACRCREVIVLAEEVK